MHAIGANTSHSKFLRYLRQEKFLLMALKNLQNTSLVHNLFTRHFGFFSQETHILAAAFVYGRESHYVSLFKNH